MAGPRQHHIQIFGIRLPAANAAWPPQQAQRLRLRTAAATLAIGFALIVIATQAAKAQTFTVLHNFTDGGDEGYPSAGLTIDRAGNLYGTTNSGGGSSGKVFKLTRSSFGWRLSPLYSFTGNDDGAFPAARVIFGPDRALFGTTYSGGGGCSCGIVFNLRPSARAPSSALVPWTETVLYRFEDYPDGSNPSYGDLVFDRNGNLYGTTVFGGSGASGTVYQLTPSHDGWTESVIYSFTGGSDGGNPYAGVVFDKAGNLYGTTLQGGAYYNGAVFQLTPSGSGWTENILYSFQNGSDGAYPQGGLILDASGNFYGTTASGGQNRAGTVFKLTRSDGSWTFVPLYSFTGDYGSGPVANLIMDQAGNLYGMTYGDRGPDYGTVFKLTPGGGSWTEIVLHRFANGDDGGSPYGSLVFDTDGNLYGTTSYGGAYDAGVVFEITP